MDVHIDSFLRHDLILLETVLVSSVTGMNFNFSLMMNFLSVLLFFSSLLHSWERCKPYKQMGFCYTS